MQKAVDCYDKGIAYFKDDASDMEALETMVKTAKATLQAHEAIAVAKAKDGAN